MAQILLHTSSLEKSLQEQALSLQNELQLFGHHVDFSTATHPFRILKNSYDIFHIMSDTDHLSFKDAALLLMAKINRTATVVSTYGFPQTTRIQSIYHKIQSATVDAFSCSNLESLKRNKLTLQRIRLKQSFILPLLPGTQPIKKNRFTSSIIRSVKVINENFNELKLNKSSYASLLNKDLTIDASALSQKMPTSDVQKAWKKFQAQNPAYQNCMLILKFETMLELIKNHPVILDLSGIYNGLQFHKYFEAAYTYRQFVILTANQASGFPDYWKHQQNCWIGDLKSMKKLSHVVESTQVTLAQTFFESDKIESLDKSYENKLNELSRVYSKIISQKNLSYASSKVHS